MNLVAQPDLKLSRAGEIFQESAFGQTANYSISIPFEWQLFVDRCVSLALAEKVRFPPFVEKILALQILQKKQDMAPSKRAAENMDS